MIEGEAYIAKTLFRERYRQLKKLKTPGLKKSTILAADEGGAITKIWIIEYEVEEVEGDGDLLGAGLLKHYPGNKLLN